MGLDKNNEPEDMKAKRIDLLIFASAGTVMAVAVMVKICQLEGYTFSTIVPSIMLIISLWVPWGEPKESNRFNEQVEVEAEKGESLSVFASAGTTMVLIIMGKIFRSEGYTFFTIMPSIILIICLWFPWGKSKGYFKK